MKHGMRMKTGIRRKRGGIWRRWLAGLLAAVMLAELVPVYARDAADGQAAESSHATVYDGGQSAADGSKSAAQDGCKNTAQASGQAGDQAVTLARREDALSKVGSATVQTKHRAAADAAGAKSTDASNAADADASDVSSAGEDAPYVLAEETALRGEAEKHFRLSDGTYLAVQYARPVHLQTADGRWADLDNELTLRQGAYRADNGLTTASFAQNLSNGELFTAGYRDYTISLALAGRDWAAAPDAGRPVTPDPAEPAATGEPEETPAAPVQGAATNPEAGAPSADANAAQGNSASSAAQENRTSGTDAAQSSTASAEASKKTDKTKTPNALSAPEPAKPGRISDAVATLLDIPAAQNASASLEQQVQPAGLVRGLLYEDAAPEIDLSYTACGFDVKEAIVVKAPQAAYRYAFRLTLDGLTPKLSDGAVLLSNAAGEVIYVIPAPYLEDAAGATSDAAAYTLSPQADGSYLLTVTADEAWMNDDSRAWPIQIDPTVELRSDNYVRGTYIRSAQPTAKAGDRSTPFAGYLTTAGQQELCVQMVLPALPKNATLVSALLSVAHVGLFTKTYANAPTGSKLQLYAYALNGLVGDAAQMTWNHVYGSGGYGRAQDPLDYRTLSTSTRGQHISWDITRAVMTQYDKNNPDELFAAITLAAKDGANAAYFASLNGHYSKNNPYGSPMLLVQYRHNAGVQTALSYHEQSIGRAGQGYVSDYDLQTTLVNPIATSASAVLPYTLSLVYNSAYRGTYFDAAEQGYHTLPYNQMHIGAGWKLSAQQTVISSQLQASSDTNPDATEEYLIYHDETGAAYYFRKDGSVFKDENGLNLTLTKSVSGSTTVYTMKDKKDNQRIFHNGYLITQRDANGNALHFTYNNAAYSASGSSWKPTTANHRLTGVTRVPSGGSAQQLMTFAYDSNRCLSEIRQTVGSATRVTKLHYSQYGAKLFLTAITFPDGKQARYRYLTGGGAASCALYQAYDAESGYGIVYHNFGSIPLRQLRVWEFSAATEPQNIPTDGDATRQYGYRFHGYSNSRQKTTYRHYGADRIAGTDDDLMETCLLDYYGRTITSYTTGAGREEVLSIASAAYTETSGTSQTNNRVERAGSGGLHAANLLKDGNFERGTTFDAWQKVVTPSSAPAGYSGLPNSAIGAANTGHPAPHLGARYLRMYSPAAPNADHSAVSVATGAQQTVTLKAGKKYTLSAYVNTSAVTQFYENGGVFLTMRSADGQDAGQSIALTAQTGKALQHGWQRLTYTFTAKASGSYTVGVQMRNCAGYAFADDIQLERNADLGAGAEDVGAAGNLNLLQNSRFDDGFTDWARTGDWKLGSQPAATKDAALSTGGKEITVVGNTVAEKRATQTVMLNAPAGSTFHVSAWAKANAAPSYNSKSTNPDWDERFFGLYIVLVYTDNTAESQHIPANTDTTEWQFVTGTVTPKQANLGKTISSIRVAADYSNNFGTATFDDFSLRLEPVQTYKYDSNGNLIRTTQTENAPESYTYSGADLTKYISGGNGTFTYTYDSKHNLTSATNDTVKMTLTNNAQGLTTSVTLADKTGSLGKTLQSSAGYSSDFRFQTSSTDVNGSTSSAEYDALGNRTAATAPNGTKTNYNYTLGTTAAATDNRLRQSYIPGKISLNYTYANGALTAARRGHYVGTTNLTQTYSFAYDTFLNPTSLKVGSNTLATYEYAAGNGNLAKQTYAAGAYTGYAYDAFDRDVIEATCDEDGNLQGKVYHAYSGEGEETERVFVDASGNRTGVQFEHDSLGRLIHSLQYRKGANETQGTLVQATEHSYDSDNRIDRQSWMLVSPRYGGRTYSERYTYNAANGSMATALMGTGRTITFTYDKLQRLTKENLNGIYNRSYQLKDLSTNRASTQISRLEYTADGGQGLSWTYYDYTYDSAGRIATYAPSVAAKYAEQYTYDELEQLTKVTKDNKTVASYTYDTAGNILTAQNATGTHSYTYGNADWRDLLTAYDGHAFTYEQSATGKPSGNPTTYYNGTEYGMTWKMGNRLATASKTGKSMTFSYDADGIRTSKAVASGNKTVTYNYLTQDGKVMRQEWDEDGVNYQLDFFYDTQGKPLAVIYRQNGDGLSYYYLTNQQGDVTKLYKPVAVSGSTKVNMVEIATYSYDPWGKATVTVNTGSQITNNDRTLANINPLRYRGYYQDVETGFYYLQSRYYDPVIGRFINADLPEYAALSATDITGTNLFAYCKNDPINHADEDGEWLNLVIGAVVGGVISGVMAGISSYRETGKVDWAIVGVNAASGAISGAIAATGIGLVGSIGANAAIGAGTYAAEQAVKHEKITVGGIVSTAVSGGISGIVGGKGANGKALEETWQSANRGIKRELRRANQKYAAKQIARHVAKKKAVKYAVGVSAARYAASVKSNTWLRRHFGY